MFISPLTWVLPQVKVHAHLVVSKVFNLCGLRFIRITCHVMQPLNENITCTISAITYNASTKNIYLSYGL